MTERPSHVRALRGSAWVFGGYASGLVLALLVNALMAKVLVPTSLGVVFLTVSAVTFGATIAQFGMETVAIRLIAHSLGSDELGRARATIWRTLAVTLTGAALVGGTLAFGLWRWIALHVFHSPEMARLHILAALMLAGVAVQNTVTSWFKGLQAMHLVAVFEGLLVNLSLCVSLFAIWLFHGGTTSTAIVAIRAAASGLVVIVMGMFLRGRIRHLNGRGGVSIGEIANMGWALMATTLVATVIGTTSDLWILGAYRPESQVASYGLSVRLASLVSLPFFAFAVAVAPIVAELSARNELREMERLIRAAVALIAIPSVIVTTVLAVFGSSVLEFVFGPHYAAAANIVLVMCIAQCSIVVTGPCGMMIIMTGHHRVAFSLVVIAAIASIAGDFWAAPRYGAIGVAVATGSVLAADNLVTTLVVKRLVGIWVLPSFSLRDFGMAIRMLRLRLERSP